jgi:DNA-binding PadR family transcriptional regulator
MVLSTLHAHPMHGYALVEVLEQGLGQALGLKRSAVYAILKRLANRGWLESEPEREGRLPQRSVYTTTSAGQSALMELTQECFSLGATTQAPLAALLPHLDSLAPQAKAELLEGLLADRLAKLASLRNFDGHTGPSGLAFDLIAGHLNVEVRILRAALELPSA